MKKEYLYPGKLVLASSATEITTILGSCVAVAFRDQKTHISGLCHYLLDKPSGGESPSPRYGNTAIPQLLEMMLKAGANRKSIQAKVYGGGNVLGGVTIGKNIGAANIQLARTVLQEHRIPILEENVGGTRGRRIVFSTEDFGVELSFMKETSGTESNTEKEAPASVVAPLGIGARVAVLDTSSSICTYFAKALRKRGFNVVGTGIDSMEGYALVYQNRLDLLILGIMEPGAEGVKILRELRKFGNLPPIIIYSFGGNGSEAMSCLELGAVDFVHTHQRFDPNALIQVSTILIEKVTAFLQFGRAA